MSRYVTGLVSLGEGPVADEAQPSGEGSHRTSVTGI